jgi:hypothetical protein
MQVLKTVRHWVKIGTLIKLTQKLTCHMKEVNIFGEIFTISEVDLFDKTTISFQKVHVNLVEDFNLKAFSS